MSNNDAKLRFLNRFIFNLVPVCFLAIILAAEPTHASGNEDISGYYFPPITSSEVVKPKSRISPDTDKAKRVHFAIGLSSLIMKRPYQAGVSIFTGGENAEVLIIVGLQDGRLNTVFRVRAVLELLTAYSRQTSLFVELGLSDIFSFLDFAHLLGFEGVVVSDGIAFTHKFIFQGNAGKPF